MNELYYGDNLGVLRHHIGNESVDLVYLDPPFNSNASYNVLFAEHDGTRAASQIKAFEDTWKWDASASRACAEVIEAGGKVSEAMQAFRTLLGDSDMMAYLAMMAPRLIELRRVLKSTGSIYLHCDPTASHYLKLLLDAVFGPEQFDSEIVWKRYGSHNDSKSYGAVHDTILYTRSQDKRFNKQHQPYEPFGRTTSVQDPDGRKWAGQSNPQTDLPLQGQEWHHLPASAQWVGTPERINSWTMRTDYYPQKKPALRPRTIWTNCQVPIQDVWTDIVTIGGTPGTPWLPDPEARSPTGTNHCRQQQRRRRSARSILRLRDHDRGSPEAQPSVDRNRHYDARRQPDPLSPQ